MNLNIAKIEADMRAGWITKRKHPDADIYILNYSPRAQIEGHWDKDTTMICRGLIVDANWNVLARPFEKFFTIDQLVEKRNYVYHWYGIKFKNLFDGNFRVFDKMDGSLGIMYPTGNKVQIATRGSFESEMAHRANKMLADLGMDDRDKWGNLVDTHTLMFEIIYPENQIVVNYDDAEKLVLLDVISIKTGLRDDVWRKLIIQLNKFEAAKEYTHIKTIEDLEKEAHDGREGYVLVFDSGLRTKWKFEEYKRLHRIVTGLNENTVWEWLKDGKNFREALDKVPDEFYNWAIAVAERFKTRYKEIECSATERFKAVKHMVSRKELAESIKDYEYKGLVFAMLDDKPYEESIWRLVKDQQQAEGWEVIVCGHDEQDE